MNKKNNKGITYVELIIVISIMAIMAGFVTISMGTVYRNNVGRAADALESATKEARNAALSKGTENGCLNLLYEDGKLYAYVGKKMMSATELKNNNYSIIAQGLDSNGGLHVTYYDGEDDYSDNPLSCTLYCIQFKQSTGECMGLQHSYVDGDDWPGDVEIRFEKFGRQSTVHIEKYGKIYSDK